MCRLFSDHYFQFNTSRFTIQRNPQHFQLTVPCKRDCLSSTCKNLPAKRLVMRNRVTTPRSLPEIISNKYITAKVLKIPLSLASRWWRLPPSIHTHSSWVIIVDEALCSASFFFSILIFYYFAIHPRRHDTFPVGLVLMKNSSSSGN